jgi:hypothetical protein
VYSHSLGPFYNHAIDALATGAQGNLYVGLFLLGGPNTNVTEVRVYDAGASATRVAEVAESRTRTNHGARDLPVTAEAPPRGSRGAVPGRWALSAAREDGMRYQTIPRWTYIMLVVMGLCFVAGAFAFILFVPAPTGAIVGGIWLVVFGGMAFFGLRALRGRADDDRIRRAGTPATATVLSATTTGLTINNVPQWKLRLRIDGVGASYEATLKLLTYTPPDNGASFGVRVDPLKHEHVVLSDDDGASGARTAPTTSPAPPVQAAVLDALRKAGLAAGETAVVNPDGSRTITTSSVAFGANDDGTPDPADTVRLLADLDRMRASGSLSEAEFEAVKAKLLARG